MTAPGPNKVTNLLTISTVRSAAPVATEVDRRAAIERAVQVAQDGDVLVIAGKGHEQGQEFAGGVKIPFDDVTVAREALGARVES